MKHFISLVLAAIIIAFVVFTMLYWLFGLELAASTEWAVMAGVSGLIVEILRPAIIRWSKLFDITANRKLNKR